MSFATHLEALETKVEAINRRPRLWLSLFALLFAVQISPWWYPKADGCFYLSVARSMVESASGDNPSGTYRPISPGYPLLISPAFLLGDRPFLAISVLHWLMAVVCILGIYHWARRQFPAYAVLITGLAVLNNAVWIHYRRTIKEIAFMAAIVWSVNILHALMHRRSNRSTAWHIGGAAILITACTMIRYPGIVLLAGFGLAMFWSARCRRLSWLRAALITVAVSLPPSLAVLYRIDYEENLAKQYGGTTYERNFHAAVSEAVSDAKSVFDSSQTGSTAPTSATREKDTPNHSVATAEHARDRQVDAVATYNGRVVTSEQPSKNLPASANAVASAHVPADSSSVTVNSNDSVVGRKSVFDRIAENRFFEGLRLRISSVGQITLPGMFKAYNRTGGWLHLSMLIYGIWFPVVLLGCWHLVRRRNDVFALSLPFYFALYVVWPFDQGARFLVPMAPVLMASAWFGMRRLPIRHTTALAMCVCMHCGVAFFYWVGLDAPRAYVLHQKWPHVDKIVGHLDQEAVTKPVAVAGFSAKERTRIRLMFELTLDTPIQEYSDVATVPESVQWVVMPTDLPLDESYERIERASGFQLIRRSSTSVTAASRMAVADGAAKPDSSTATRRH